jgi:hypothetical protein
MGGGALVHGMSVMIMSMLMELVSYVPQKKEKEKEKRKVTNDWGSG